MRVRPGLSGGTARVRMIRVAQTIDTTFQRCVAGLFMGGDPTVAAPGVQPRRVAHSP